MNNNSKYITRTFIAHHLEYYDNKGIRQSYDTIAKNFNVNAFLEKNGIRSIKAVKKYTTETKIKRMSLEEFFRLGIDIQPELRYKG